MWFFFLKTVRSIENFHEIKCGKLFSWKKVFYLYSTIPPQRLQSKGRVFVQTPQCQLFWPSVRVTNNFAVWRAALCGQHVLFLTAQRCFDDGWQSSVSGTCLLTWVIGGNVSEPVARSEWPNHGMENANAGLRGVSKDGASLPYPHNHTHTCWLCKVLAKPVLSRIVSGSRRWEERIGQDRRGQEEGPAGHGHIPAPLHCPCSWKEALLLS